MHDAPLHDGKTQPLHRPLAPVRLVILGLNFGLGIARHVVRDVKSVQLVGLCDLDQPKLDKACRELGVTPYAELETVLADPEVEAVGLFSGPLGRAALISKILRAGKHVITTKPFETDLTAAAAVLGEAKRLGRVVHLNSPTPVAMEDVAQIHAWARLRDLGRPVSLLARTWARYREQANGSWYDDPKLCPVAPLLRLGIYFLNDFAPLLGEPESVHVWQSRLFTGRPTVDHAQASIRFQNGATAAVMASFCVEDGRPYQDEVTLNYEKGTIRRWMERQKAPDMSQDHAVLELHKPGEFERYVTKPGRYAGWYDWEAFQRAVRQETSVPWQNPDAILYGLRLLGAIRRSAESGQVERVLP